MHTKEEAKSITDTESAPQEKKPKKKFSKVLILGITAAIFLVICLSFLLYSKSTTTTSPEKKIPLVLKTASVSKGSTVTISKNTALYSLQGYDAILFKTQASGLDAAWEFINEAPYYGTARLLPENFAKEAVLARNVQDSDDPFMQQNNVQSTSEHYFFEQKIQGTPVFGAKLAIHLRNGNEIYAVEGNVVSNQQVDARKISDDTAQTIALEKAKLDAEPNANVTVKEAQTFILNKKVLYESEDETNYLTLAYTIKAENPQQATVPLIKQYFVDLSSGTIVYELEKIHYALQRDIQCNGGNCSKGRREGEPPVGNQIDTLYDWAGEYYNYFFTNFQRDSLNGRGQTLAGELLRGDEAAYGDGAMHIGDDMVYENVVMHEFTHGLTEATSRLDGNSGAETLNEAMSDIFGVAISRDWSQSTPGTGEIRNAQDPLRAGNADVIFSDKWLCSGNKNAIIHKNADVATHSIYLMFAGGNKNSCTIQPIGDQVYKIVYQAQTKYLNNTSNYGGYYTAMTNACNDLFQQGSTQCTTVQAALVATQIDQYPANASNSPRCSGATAKAPVCPAYAAVTTPGVASPAPTAPAGVPSPQCLGGICPTDPPSPTVPLPTQPVVNPTQPVVIPTQPSGGGVNPTIIAQLPTQQPPTSGGGATGGGGGNPLTIFIAFILLLLKLFLGLFGG